MASRFKNLVESLNLNPVPSEILTEDVDSEEWKEEGYEFRVPRSPDFAAIPTGQKNVEIWADSYNEEFKRKIEQFAIDFQKWLETTGNYITKMYYSRKLGDSMKDVNFQNLLKDEKAIAFRLTKIYQRAIKS